ncbi:MAG: hypothetical protein JW910_09455 [Anaerolineae bacterium]|nr:hypothetical protein [Anaerolineae bacterium]
MPKAAVVIERLLERYDAPTVRQSRRVTVGVAAATLLIHAGYVAITNDPFGGLFLLSLLALVALPLVVATQAAHFTTQEAGGSPFDLLLLTPVMPELLAEAYVEIAARRMWRWRAAGWGLLPVIGSPLLLQTLYGTLSAFMILAVLIVTLTLVLLAGGQLTLLEAAVPLGVSVGLARRRESWQATLLAPLYTVLTWLIIWSVVLVPAVVGTWWLASSSSEDVLYIVLICCFGFGASPILVAGVIAWLTRGPAYNFWLERARRAVVNIVAQ